MKSEAIDKLVAALCKFQADVEPIRKDASNPYFKSKYADLAGCIDTAKRSLSANGLAVSQPTRVDGNGNIIVMTFLMHTSGQFIMGEYLLTPIKTDPQTMGGALTYARRYSFLAILGLAPEDDDGAAASGTVKAPFKAHPPQVVYHDTPGEYVVTFGFYKGKKLKEIPIATLKKQVEYVEALREPPPAGREFLINAKAYRNNSEGVPQGESTYE